MTFTRFGKRWSIPNEALKSPDLRRPYWKWLIGCPRCLQVCTDFAKCKCCELPKGQRPYGAGEGHIRLMEMPVFLAKVAA